MCGEVAISVVIPSYNSGKTIKQCLDAVVKNKTDIQYEVIVIDSSPNDSVQNICRAYSESRYTKLADKTLPGLTRNIGAEASRGEVLLFLDADILLKENALTSVWRQYQNGNKIFSGALDLADDLANHFPSVVEHSFFFHEAQKTRSIKKRKNLNSAILVFKKTVFLESGGFNNLPRMQDAELTERLNRSGIDLFFVPTVVGQHLHKSSMRQVFRKVYLNGNNLYYIRYQNKLSLLKTCALFTLLPVISFAKMSRVILRNIKYNLWGVPLHLKLIPMMYMCGFIWMSGLYYAIVFKKGISALR